MENKTTNVGKWYTISEFYNEEGVQITKQDAKKNYIIVNKTIKTTINGNTRTKTIWNECQRDKQLKIF